MFVSRPKYLNLFAFRFPLSAIVSILHRLSGLFIFLLIPCLLWVLSCSLTPIGFVALQMNSHNVMVKIIVWLFLSAFSYHVIAGLRHLLLDLHVGVGLKGSKISASFVLILSILWAIILGIWLW